MAVAETPVHPLTLFNPSVKPHTAQRMGVERENRHKRRQQRKDSLELVPTPICFLPFTSGRAAIAEGDAIPYAPIISVIEHQYTNRGDGRTDARSDTRTDNR